MALVGVSLDINGNIDAHTGSWSHFWSQLRKASSACWDRLLDFGTTPGTGTFEAFRSLCETDSLTGPAEGTWKGRGDDLVSVIVMADWTQLDVTKRPERQGSLPATTVDMTGGVNNGKSDEALPYLCSSRVV